MADWERPHAEEIIELTPAKLEEIYRRQQTVIRGCSYDSLVTGGLNGIVNAAESVRRSLAWEKPTKIMLPNDSFRGGDELVLFDSARFQKNLVIFPGFKSAGLPMELSPYADMRLRVVMSRLRETTTLVGGDTNILINLGSKDLIVTESDGRSGVLRPQTISGPYGRNMVCWGKGEVLGIMVDGMQHKTGSLDSNEVSVTKLVDEAYERNKVPGITNNGGKDKRWFWGPNGGELGQLERVAIGAFVSPNVLLEGGVEAYRHPMASQIILALPMRNEFQGVRPIFYLYGISSFALGRIGVWSGNDQFFETQKIMPPGWMYILIHTYPQSKLDGQPIYLKQALIPRSGLSTPEDVKKILNAWGFKSVE